jgi:hypothetical protein
VKNRSTFKHQREEVRATMQEVKRCVGELNESQRGSFGEEQIKLLFMTDAEIYHHFMDHPVQEITLKNGITFTLITFESGLVPRLFKVITPRGEKFVVKGVPLSVLRPKEEGGEKCQNH